VREKKNDWLRISAAQDVYIPLSAIDPLKRTVLVGGHRTSPKVMVTSLVFYAWCSVVVLGQLVWIATLRVLKDM